MLDEVESLDPGDKSYENKQNSLAAHFSLCNLRLFLLLSPFHRLPDVFVVRTMCALINCRNGSMKVSSTLSSSVVKLRQRRVLQML